MANVVSMPKLGFDMAEGALVRWVVLEGDKITKGSVLAEIETDKATVEVESTFEGIVLKHLAQEGDILPINTPIAVIGAPGESLDLRALGLEGAVVMPAGKAAGLPVLAKETSITLSSEQAPAASETGMVSASPLARRMANERGVDIRMLVGTGPGGRVVKKDIEAFPASTTATMKAAVLETTLTAPEAASPIPSVPAAREDQRITITRLRSAIGRRMTESKQQAPHFYLTREFDVAELVALRKQINLLLPETEKTSVNDYVIKATALALQKFPNLNASFDGSKNEIIQHGAINIGVAVAIDQGLLIVVCRNADLKSIRQIAVEMRSLAGRARQGKVRPEDIEGSTFSISNLGMFDIEQFEAIINPPEAAILAVGVAREVPVVKDGEIQPGMRMKATVSVDHRVSDGAEAARLLQEISTYLEEPVRLLLN